MARHEKESKTEDNRTLGRASQNRPFPKWVVLYGLAEEHPGGHRGAFTFIVARANAALSRHGENRRPQNEREMCFRSFFVNPRFRVWAVCMHTFIGKNFSEIFMLCIWTMKIGNPIGCLGR